MAARRASKRIAVGSGNVFAELGLPDAAELDTKVRLVVEINRQLEECQLSQAAAASRLAIGQPKVPALKNYKLDGFSVERLMALLTALGQDVEIRIRAWGRTTASGRVFVQAA